MRRAEETKQAVCITYFAPDSHKSGGSYADVVGQVKKIDVIGCTIRLIDGVEIPVVDVIEVSEMDTV